jgi:hypothetical protein
MTDLSRRLALNRHLVQHFAELGALLKRPVRREDLLSVEETEVILRRSKEVERAPSWKVEIPFAHKMGDRFRRFTSQLVGKYAGEVYLWTPLANDCGMSRSVTLADINFDFRFDTSPNGILTVLSTDLRDKLLLDYFRNDHDQETLAIEASGERWGTVRY